VEEAFKVFGVGVLSGAVSTFLCLWFVQWEIKRRPGFGNFGSLDMDSYRPVGAPKFAPASNREAVVEELCRLPLCDNCKRAIG